MNINVSVKIDSPELMAAILTLAEALPQMKLNGEATAASLAEETKKVSVEDIRAKLAELQRGGKKAEVKELIKKFGGSKLSEVKAEDYEALLREANSTH